MIQDGKILYAGRRTAFQSIGGADIQLLKTKNYLEESSDLEIEIFSPVESNIEEADILHIFDHLTGNELIEYAKEKNVKTVLSSIYWDHGKESRISRPERIKRLLYQITRFLDINIFDRKKKLFEDVDLILPNSKAERDLIKSKFNLDSEKFHVVPNAVDKEFAEASPEPFIEEYNLNDFILFVGRIEPRKNLYLSLRALEEIDKDIVVVGPAGSNQDYAEKCREISKENVHFIGKLDHESELLKSAYAAADIFLLPSQYETPGLSALEAGLANTKIVITERGTTREYFQDYAYYINPEEPETIREAIENAQDAEFNPELKNRILENFTWERTAKETFKAYQKLLD